MIYKLHVLTFLASFFYAFAVEAQHADYKHHSVFISNFTRHIEWPSHVSDKVYTVGVLGDDKVAREMMSYFARQSDHAIVVKHFPHVEAMSYCHVLFIPNSSDINLAQVLQRIGSSPTLIVTEKEGWGKKGSTINFVTSPDGKIRFELNKAAAERHNLKVYNYLLNLAIKI